MPTLAGYLRKNRLTRGTVTASCRASYYPPGCASIYPVSVLRPTDRFPSKTGFTLVTACFQLAGHITRDVARASQRHAARTASCRASYRRAALVFTLSRSCVQQTGFRLKQGLR
jgi:hypothetical protein